MDKFQWVDAPWNIKYDEWASELNWFSSCQVYEQKYTGLSQFEWSIFHKQFEYRFMYF